MGRWCKSHEDDSGKRIAKARDGLRPVDFTLEGFALLLGDFAAMRPQARAALAGDDAGGETPEFQFLDAWRLRHALIHTTKGHPAGNPE
jgi:hypothetical protein